RADRAPRMHDKSGRDRLERPRPASRSAALEGGVWFRAAIGRQKKAEARWLLPMICRRGGIGKQDIGAIRIFETHTEFEITASAADQFGMKIKRPDREDNIRIEPLKSEPHPSRAPDDTNARARPDDRPAFSRKKDTRPA